MYVFILSGDPYGTGSSTEGSANSPIQGFLVSNLPRGFPEMAPIRNIVLVTKLVPDNCDETDGCDGGLLSIAATIATSQFKRLAI